MQRTILVYYAMVDMSSRFVNASDIYNPDTSPPRRRVFSSKEMALLSFSNPHKFILSWGRGGEVDPEGLIYLEGSQQPIPPYIQTLYPDGTGTTSNRH
jgi:hypothetical protein